MSVISYSFVVCIAAIVTVIHSSSNNIIRGKYYIPVIIKISTFVSFHIRHIILFNFFDDQLMESKDFISASWPWMKPCHLERQNCRWS